MYIANENSNMRFARIEEEEQKPSIFGKPLDDIISKHGGPVPPIITQCVEILRKTCIISFQSFKLTPKAQTSS